MQGRFDLRSVTAVDGPASPLMGMSFLGRCRSWSLDNERETLVLTAYAR